MYILLLLLISVGAYSLISQIIFMRTLSQVFYGNELSLGMILFLWLFYSGIGTLLTSRFWHKMSRLRTIYILSICILANSLLLPLILFFISKARTIAGLLPGEVVTISFLITTSAAALFLHAFIQGSLFCCACTLHEKMEKKSDKLISWINNVYILESFGAFLGGLYYFLIGKVLFSLSMNVFFINMLYCSTLLLFIRKKKLRILSYCIILIIAVHACAFLFSPYIEKVFIENLYHPFTVKDHVNTKYGQTTVLQQSAKEFSLFKDGVIEDDNVDEYAAEELAYYGLLQFKNMPRSILILGGGQYSLISKLSILKNAHITAVEPDKALYDFIERSSFNFTSPQKTNNVTFVFDNIRPFLQKCRTKFDYIILASPPPYTLALNRFYTQEFYKDIDQLLTSRGVFSFRVPSSENLINEDLAAFLRSIDNTTKNVFPDSAIIPGNTCIFILSNTNGMLTTDPEKLSARADALPFITHFVNSGYIPFRASKERQAHLKDRIEASSFQKNNSMLHPLAFYFDFMLWSSKTSPRLTTLLAGIYSIPFPIAALTTIICVIILSVILTHRKRSRFTLFFAITSLGFTEISLEIILLLAYQSIFGYVYTALALLIAFYMAGLIIGSILSPTIDRLLNKKRSLPLLPVCSIAMILSCLGISLYVITFSSLPAFLQSSALFYVFIVGSGIIGGIQFVAINTDYLTKEVSANTKVGNIYGSDMIGSAIGALATSLALIPIYGIPQTLIILILLNVCASAFLIIWPSR